MADQTKPAGIAGLSGFKPAGQAATIQRDEAEEALAAMKARESDQSNAENASENLDAERIVGTSEAAVGTQTVEVGAQRGQLGSDQEGVDYVNMRERISEMAESQLNHHYSSRPIARYVLDRFEFKDSYLSLNDEDAAEFERILSKQPVSEQVRIAKLSRAPTPIVEKRMFAGVDHSENAPAASKPTQA